MKLNKRLIINEGLNPEKVQNAIEKHGSRKVASSILDIAVRRLAGGISMMDLSDTPVVANGIDGIEDALDEQDYDGAWNIATETAEEMLADEGFPVDMGESTISEKSKSKAQQQFMGMVHACQKKGGKCASKEVAKAAKSMSKKDAKDFASTKHKGLPEKKVKEESVMNIQKKLAVNFINNICEKNYSSAKKNLADIVNEKIKARIKRLASN